MLNELNTFNKKNIFPIKTILNLINIKKLEKHYYEVTCIYGLFGSLNDV